MASVKYKKVYKRFDGDTEALQDFDLQVKDGELMVLVGPSGCGKSTALRLLAGLEALSSGEIWIDEVMVNEMTPQQRNIAMVFQNYALYPHMSVQQNLAFPLRMSKLARDEITKRVNWAADLLQLNDLLERMPGQLSGGQRQRVAMGRAIVREPRVFLMDEPLSNLDAKLRIQIRTEIAALQRRLNITTLYVTHDQVEAMTLGDRVAVMNDGRLQQVAEPQLLYERPENIFVARFIGSPGMNVLRTRLQQTAAGLAFELNGNWLPLVENGRISQERLLPCIDQPLYIGLRPESLVLANETAITWPLVMVEALGHEQLLYFEASQAIEAKLIVRVPGNREFSVGDRIALQISAEELYWFDQHGVAIY